MLFKTEIHSFDDARRLARRYLPWMVFDYIDGAAGSEFGEQLNRDTLRGIRLMPRVLNNVEQRRLGVQVFGKDTGLPFGISPMGMCNLSRPGADLMLARLATSRKIPQCVSTVASTSLEEIIKEAQGNAWFQLYFSGDEAASMSLIQRAENAGYETLLLTVDVPEVGRRLRELRRGFKMPFRIGFKQFVDFALHPAWSLSSLYYGKPDMANFGGQHAKFDRHASRAGADWRLLERIRSAWKGKLVIKGVLNPDDAIAMKERGVDGIIVSSHGGRQLDSAPPPIVMLPRIRQAVGPDFQLFYDSGIRSGEDVVKAYALGADFVFMGRPFLYAIAAGGERGLQQFVDVTTSDISITLAQLGLTSMSAVNADCLYGEISVA